MEWTGVPGPVQVVRPLTPFSLDPQTRNITLVNILHKLPVRLFDLLFYHFISLIKPSLLNTTQNAFLIGKAL